MVSLVDAAVAQTERQKTMQTYEIRHDGKTFMTVTAASGFDAILLAVETYVGERSDDEIREDYGADPETAVDVDWSAVGQDGSEITENVSLCTTAESARRFAQIETGSGDTPWSHRALELSRAAASKS